VDGEDPLAPRSPVLVVLAQAPSAARGLVGVYERTVPCHFCPYSPWSCSPSARSGTQARLEWHLRGTLMERCAQSRDFPRAERRGGRDILVVLDGGTESVRAAAVCAETGAVLASAARAYPTHTPQNGWAEQSSADWWAAAVTATRACLASAAEVDVTGGDQVRAVSFVTTTCTLLPVGVDGPLCPAMLWSDVRAAAQAERIFATGHAAVKRVSSAGFSAVRDSQSYRAMRERGPL
jgi:hypothetical protein